MKSSYRVPRARNYLIAAFAAAVISLLPGLASAVTYTVGTSTDFPITTVNSANGQILSGAGIGQVTLRSAVIAANQSGVGPHIINVPAALGPYNLSQLNPNSPATTATQGFNDLQIGSNLSTITVQGTGGTAKIVQTVAGNDVITTGFKAASTPAVVNLTLDHLEITGGTFTGIFTGVDDGVGTSGNISSTTITNCFIHDNSNSDATFGQGGAIFNQTGNLTVSNSTFSNNSALHANTGQGGAIFYNLVNSAGQQGSVGALSITNNVFTGNKASIKSGFPGGGAIFVGVSSAGAAITISGNTFSSNIADGGGDGGAVAIANGASRVVNLTANHFTSNQVTNAAGHGGAIHVQTGPTNINFNRFVNNSAATATNGHSIYHAVGNADPVDANSNWWSINTGPAANHIAGAAVTQAKWLQLKATASPTNVCPTGPGNTSTITASFLLDSASGVVSTANLPALIGQPISFANPVLGTLSGAQAAVQANGQATVTFTPSGTSGNGSVNAIVDNVPGNDAVAKATVTVDVPASITGQPNDQAIVAPNSAVFTVTAVGTGATYQWFKGATPLSNGATGTGSIISGATTATLTISLTSPLDNATDYHVVVTTACATATSNNVSLTVIVPPDAPTIGTATAGNAQASVTFTPPANNGGGPITSYTVTSSPGGFTGSGAGSPIVVSGLTNGTAYTFTVTATNVAGTGPASAASNSVTPVGVPGAPTIGVATAGNAQASITFTPPASNGGSAITGYTVTSSPGGFTGSGAGSPIVVTGLTNGTAYTFTVTATNAAGTGPASAASNSVTPATVPGAPTIGVATPGNTQASVTFTPPASNGGSAITGYTVTSSPGGFTGSGAGSPIVVTGLTNGTAYTFTVTATNAIGTGAASAASNSVTPATVPGAPTIGTATAGNAQASVTFAAPASDGGSAITSYTVTSSPGGFTGSGAGSPIVVTGLTNGTAYTFTVTATNAIGTGPASAASNSVTPIGPPGAPTIGVATAGNTQASVTFTPPASNGGSAITGYTVTSSPGGITGVGVGSPIVVSGLTNGTAYTFTVTATNAVGTGPASAASNAVTPATVPGAPTIGIATPGNAQASVAFTPPASNGGSAITSYTVTSSPGGFTGSGAGSPIVVTGLTNGTAYTFTVTATNAIGTGAASAASNSVTPATVPGAPTIGTATAGNAQASVTFAAPASDGGSAITSYTVTSNPGGLTGTGAGSPIVVTGLTNGTAYTFTVTATNAIGTGPASAASNSVTPVTIPGIPPAPAATAGNAQATVTITAPVSDGGSAITGYTVISSPAGGVDSNAGTPGLSHIITGLTNGTAYTFTVTATNAVGTSAASAASNSVTPATVPGAPTIGIATAGNTQASVTFTPPASNGGSAITSYTVTSNPGGFTGTGAGSPIVVTGLTNGTAYTFTVTATNTVGTGPASSASNSVTPTNQPDLSIADVTTTEGSGGGKLAVFTISLSGPAPAGGVTYDIATADGTATAGSDYVARSLTGQTIAAGQTSATFDVTINGDKSSENDETFTVTVSNVVGAIIVRGQAVGTIANDDQPNPLARPDVYVTGVNQPLIVDAASGVLANDRDAGGSALLATATTLPTDGLLSFANDGSFRYFPNQDFSGIDKFTYQVCNLANECSSAIVILHVSQPLADTDHYLWLVPPASNTEQQGFIRLTNRESNPGLVTVWGIDSLGARSSGTITLTLAPDESRQFNSQDLELGNPGKGLTGSIGSGEGNWTVIVRTGLDIEALAYIRTPDGFLTSMHDRVVGDGVDWFVPMFNPAENPNQVSHLRIINTELATTGVQIRGVDDAGISGGPVTLTLPPLSTIDLSSSDLESGNADKRVIGKLGDGTGKWQLTVSATGRITVQSLLYDPKGYLTNLSTLPDLSESVPGERMLWLVPPASNTQQQGFVRLVNRENRAGDVAVWGIDDSGQRSSGTVTLNLAANESRQFTAQDLEVGNPGKGLTGSLGDGTGNWRLVVLSDLNIAPMSLIRTPDGFLTSIHDVIAGNGLSMTVPTFNPADNPNQTSLLRLVNPNAAPVSLTIRGTDDAGHEGPNGQVTLTLAAGAAIELNANDLENGNPAKGLVGSLGNGSGKWLLLIGASAPVKVMSLLRDPAGYLTNLSNGATGSSGELDP